MDSYDFMMRNGRKGHYITSDDTSDDDPVMDEEQERENRMIRIRRGSANASKNMDKATTGRPRKRLKGELC